MAAPTSTSRRPSMQTWRSSASTAWPERAMCATNSWSVGKAGPWRYRSRFSSSDNAMSPTRSGTCASITT